MNLSREFSRRARPVIFSLAAILVLWSVVSYHLLPDWWMHHEKQHPALLNAPKLTITPAGIPGDPLNLFVICSKEDLTAALLEAGWYPADPLTLETSLRIAGDSVLRRSYDDAPVSTLLLFGRMQDLAFEKPIGNDPRERHHVRFWQAPERDKQGRVAWWAAATFDHSIGFSHTTGQITHHISPEIDNERDLVLRDLGSSGFTDVSYQVNFQDTAGKNGGGDSWRSDGKLGIAISNTGSP